MRRVLITILFLLALSPSLAWAKKPKKEPPKRDYFIVTKVIYGDTIVLDDGRTIRMIGVYAPKLKEKMDKDGKIKKPNALVESWQNDSINFTKALILDQPVWLEYEKKAPISPDYTWAYVKFGYPYPDSKKKWEWNGPVPVLLLPGEYTVNRLLLEFGYANSNSPFNFKWRATFNQIEYEARRKGRGLWMKGF